MSDPQLATVLEAILFGAGRSMSLEELSQILGEPKGVIHVGLSNLRKDFEQREGGALQLTDVSGRWIFEVKPELSSFLPETFRPTIPATSNSFLPCSNRPCEPCLSSSNPGGLSCLRKSTMLALCVGQRRRFVSIVCRGLKSGPAVY